MDYAQIFKGAPKGNKNAAGKRGAGAPADSKGLSGLKGLKNPAGTTRTVESDMGDDEHGARMTSIAFVSTKIVEGVSGPATVKDLTAQLTKAGYKHSSVGGEPTFTHKDGSKFFILDSNDEETLVLHSPTPKIKAKPTTKPTTPSKDYPGSSKDRALIDAARAEGLLKKEESNFAQIFKGAPLGNKNAAGKHVRTSTDTGRDKFIASGGEAPNSAPYANHAAALRADGYKPTGRVVVSRIPHKGKTLVRSTQHWSNGKGGTASVNEFKYPDNSMQRSTVRSGSQGYTEHGGGKSSKSEIEMALGL